MIWYEVDEFIHIWLAEHFIAQSYIYPDVMGEVPTLSHFPLEPGCEDYSFLDQAVEDLENGLDSILTDPVDAPELKESLDEADAISSSFSSVFFHFISTVSDTSRLLTSYKYQIS